MTQSAKTGFFWKSSNFICSVHSYFPPLETSSRPFNSLQSPVVLHANNKETITLSLSMLTQKKKKSKTCIGSFAVDCLMQLKKQKAENAPLKSPGYAVSIQLPGYTSSRHKATIVLIVFWYKYSHNCSFHLKVF